MKIYFCLWPTQERRAGALQPSAELHLLLVRLTELQLLMDYLTNMVFCVAEAIQEVISLFIDVILMPSLPNIMTSSFKNAVGARKNSWSQQTNLAEVKSWSMKNCQVWNIFCICNRESTAFMKRFCFYCNTFTCFPKSCLWHLPSILSDLTLRPMKTKLN